MNGRGMQTCNLLNDTIDVWAVSEPLVGCGCCTGKGDALCEGAGGGGLSI